MNRKASQGGRLIILGAFGIILAMLVCGFLLFIALKASVTPADLLPSDSTMALFHGITTEKRAQLLQAFPSLTVFPTVQDKRSVDVAILSLPDHSSGWATFEKQTKKNQGIFDFFRSDTYTVISSSPDVEALLHTKMTPLSASGPFLALFSSDLNAETWAFVNVRVLQSSPEQANLFADHLSAPLFFLSWNNGELHASVLSSAQAGTAPLLPSLDPPPSDCISISAPGVLYEALLRSLAPERQNIVEGLARQWWTQLAGDDSFVRDFPILLNAPGSLSLSAGSGSRFLLTTSDTPDTDALIERMHTSVRERVQPFSVQRRTLTQGFAATTIEEDPSLVLSVSDVRDGWSYRETSQAQKGEALLTATKEGQLLISNDRVWMDEMMHPPPDQTPQTALNRSEQELAVASVSTTSATSWLKTFGLELPLHCLAAFLPDGDTVNLSAVRRGRILTIVVKKG